jgi:hypothetical protein
LPPDTNLESVRKKLALDLVYIQHLSLWLDIRLLVGTAIYLVGCSYNTVRRLMRLPNVGSAPALKWSEHPLDPHAQIVPIAMLVEMIPAAQPTPEMSSV